MVKKRTDSILNKRLRAFHKHPAHLKIDVPDIFEISRAARASREAVAAAARTEAPLKKSNYQCLILQRLRSCCRGPRGSRLR